MIAGGDGTDSIFGDDGRMFAPTIVGLPVPLSELKQTAIEFYDNLRDVQYLAADIEAAAFSAHAQLLTVMVADAIALYPGRVRPRVPLPDLQLHTLTIGNDVVDGGAGNDFIVGDRGAVVAPFLTGPAANNGGVDITEVGRVLLTDTKRALLTEQRVRDKELNQHLKTDQRWADHGGIRSTFPKLENLQLIRPDYEYVRSSGNDVLLGSAGNDILIGDMGVAYVPVVLSTVANNTARPEVLQAALDRLTRATDGIISDPTGVADLGRRSLFDKQFRAGVQERGGAARKVNVTTSNDRLDGGADDDLLIGDHGGVSSPFMAGVPATQFGARTARFDVKALIRDFGHALPGTPLTKPLAIQSVNIVPKTKLASGSDILVGGTGDDVLLGTKADALSDTSGVNFVETDGSQRNKNRINIGADFELSTSVRKFLASLAANPNGLKIVDGKAGTIGR